MPFLQRNRKDAKMKTLITSDLHLEFHKDYGKSLIVSLPEAEAIIIAGDIALPDMLKRSFEMLCNKYDKVIAVLGNHDHYHRGFKFVDRLIPELKAEFPNLHLLNNERIMIGNQGIVGATFWFAETALSNNPMNQQYISDFHCISHCAPMAYLKHEESVRFFKKSIQPGDIVITHHMPSYRLVHPKYQSSQLNVYFASDNDELFEKSCPKMWVVGHSHLPLNKTIGSTRFICNAIGYPLEQEADFNPNLIIDI